MRRGRVLYGSGAKYDRMLPRFRSGEFTSDDTEILYRSPRPDSPMPSRIPVGRVTFRTGPDVADALLDVRTGLGHLPDGTRVLVDPEDPLVFVERDLTAELCPAVLAEIDVNYGRSNSDGSLPPPQRFEEVDLQGWTQSGVDDRTICFACRGRGDEGWVGTLVFGDGHDHAVAVAAEALDRAPGFERAVQRSTEWYENWWSRSPEIEVEASHIQRSWLYSMFKVANMCRPGSPAPTLQGPWVEDDVFPAWQSDYHFNINVQMAHWPLLSANHPEQYEPLIRMLRGWLPMMREEARIFLGIENGVLLSLASSDRYEISCACVPFQIDPANAAWMALQLWEYYCHTGDRDSLLEVIHPMLTGAMRVYAAMIQADPDGRGFWAVSPEYRAPEGAVWFRNPSFQLAFVKALARILPLSQQALGIREPELPSWLALAGALPNASVVNGEIALGEGRILSECHRHPSHLAGVYPCEIFDIEKEDFRLVDHSSWRWTRLGHGSWAGWTFPWVARLWTRIGEPEASGLALDLFVRHFTHDNYFSSHNAFHRGVSEFLGPQPPYVMQLDGTAGFAAALMDTMAFEYAGEVRLPPRIPNVLGEVVFRGIRLSKERIAGGSGKGGDFQSNITRRGA